MTVRPRKKQTGRSTGTPSRRPRGRAKKRKSPILIVGEGRKTEPNYFRELRLEEFVKAKFAVEVKKGKGGSRCGIVQNAIKLREHSDQDYDETWCIMDIEQLDTEEKRRDFEDAGKLAEDNKIKLCLSNPAFEVWLLAHLTRTCRQFNNCDAVILELNKKKHWRTVSKVDYDKSDRNNYARIRKLTPTAIANAKAVREKDHQGKTDIADCNSATEVYKIVSKLLGN